MADLPTADVVTNNDPENLKKELLENLASKRDLAQYVTKEDFRQELAKVATKEEVNTLRTELLNKLATRESVDVLANQVFKNTNDITEIKTRLNDIDWKIGDIREEIKVKFDAILNAVDNLSRKFDEDRTKKAVIDHALNRHDDRLDDHEIRINIWRGGKLN